MGEELSIYHSWRGMKKRCCNTNHEAYHNYGGRGIKVCDRWINSYDNFRRDMGVRPSMNHTIDRIDNDGDYEPSNCKWSTRKEQANNKRNNTIVHFNGKDITVSEFAAIHKYGADIDNILKEVL